MLNLEMLSATEIVDSFNSAKYEAMKESRYTEFMNTEYEVYFKALAQKTGGSGSLLWNESPADSIMEYGEYYSDLDYALDLMKKQAGWLRKVGLNEAADLWDGEAEECEDHINELREEA